tara:strand:+ start:260 stop:451 length:192 start_codon:yes stop_codon:yes gene_type:complete
MKKLTISSSNITQKQWNILLLELNTITKEWKQYADLKIETPGLKKVINWGTKRYDPQENKNDK